LCSFVFFVVSPMVFPVFPITAITRSPDLFAALCRCTLSQTPTPHRRFVENKRQTPIRKACRKAVDLSFSCFFRSESRCLCLISARHSQFVPIVSLFAGEYPANHVKA
jgi:hypothetical protein